ncbi:hypothetical protein AO367_0310 [Moraxella catarrhalis]|nr:hypothetical protein AO380_0573 [Moraxella catarrhalis]OAV31790.1 hypothetical protein AO367_0310 [Moraxella catarrhalis]
MIQNHRPFKKYKLYLMNSSNQITQVKVKITHIIAYFYRSGMDF